MLEISKIEECVEEMFCPKDYLEIVLAGNEAEIYAGKITTTIQFNGETTTLKGYLNEISPKIADIIDKYMGRGKPMATQMGLFVSLDDQVIFIKSATRAEYTALQKCLINEFPTFPIRKSYEKYYEDLSETTEGNLWEIIKKINTPKSPQQKDAFGTLFEENELASVYNVASGALLEQLRVYLEEEILERTRSRRNEDDVH